MRIQLTQQQQIFLDKLSIKVNAGAEYRYIPVWFKRIDADTYDVITADDLPPKAIEELKKVGQTAYTANRGLSGKMKVEKSAK